MELVNLLANVNLHGIKPNKYILIVENRIYKISKRFVIYNRIPKWIENLNLINNHSCDFSPVKDETCKFCGVRSYACKNICSSCEFLIVRSEFKLIDGKFYSWNNKSITTWDENYETTLKETFKYDSLSKVEYGSILRNSSFIKFDICKYCFMSRINKYCQVCDEIRLIKTWNEIRLVVFYVNNLSILPELRLFIMSKLI